MLYWIIGIIIIIFVLLMLWKIFKKKDENISNIAFFTLGSTLILNAGGDKLDWMLKCIAITKNREYAFEMTQDFKWQYFILGIILIIISIWLTCYKRKKVKILNINGYFKRNLDEYIEKNKDLSKNIREYEINIIDIYNRLFKDNLDNESYQCIIGKIQEDVKSFKNLSESGKKGYTGIAPIPFIMYAGTFLGRQKFDEYYEFDKKEKHTYYKLKDKKLNIYPKLKVKQEIKDLDKNKKDVVIAISITSQITNEQLIQFNEKCNIVNIGIEHPCDNAIKSKKQLIEYTNIIFDTIQNIFEMFGKIENVHIVCSSQSCLAIEMGKRSIDDTRLPQMIIYQFEAQNGVKYPWGIKINGREKGKLIVIEKENIEKNV